MRWLGREQRPGRPEFSSTIYVVEPDGATREELKGLLDGLGCPVSCHASAEEFLRAFRPESAACLITELKLPGLTGLELMAHVGRSGLTVPSIVLTGNGSVRDAVKALREGAVSAVSKPLRKSALIHEIRRILPPDATR